MPPTAPPVPASVIAEAVPMAFHYTAERTVFGWELWARRPGKSIRLDRRLDEQAARDAAARLNRPLMSRGSS